MELGYCDIRWVAGRSRVLLGAVCDMGYCDICLWQGGLKGGLMPYG